MSVTFTYHGGMFVEIVRSDGFRILIDPYLTGNPHTNKIPQDFADADLILVTHYAFDHYGDTPAILEISHAQLLCGTDTYLHLARTHPHLAARAKKTIYGDSKAYGPTIVRCVRAFHVSRGEISGIPVFGPPMGFVLQIEPGTTYYHTGDTCLYSDMKLLRELYHPDVMCVGISRIKESSSQEMTCREAAIAVSWVGARVVIPTHYIPGSPDLEEFLLNLRFLAPDVIAKTAIDRGFCYHPAYVTDMEDFELRHHEKEKIL